MTEPTISFKGLIKLGFEPQDNGDWHKQLIDDVELVISITEGICDGGGLFTNCDHIPFDSITYKQAKAIIEVFGTRF